jgi:hypothetical protein
LNFRIEKKKTKQRLTFLPQVGLALLDRADDHVADASGRQTVESGSEALDGDDVQVLSARVVGAVDCGRHWQTERNSELATTNTSST